ncbi:integrase catalytic domain-containing protein [Trichonephila clavipes]|nr:integrase catalytic domain-containing protein [Trichonephila clavipes]
MAQWVAEGFDTHPMDASIRLEQTKQKVLGMAWQTLDDCLTLDTKGLLEFVSINENTKRFMLQTIGKIFDPLGLLSPFTIRIKCLIQELWIKKKVTWDEILPPKVKEKWLIWCKELPLLDNLRIPRLVLDSTNDEVSDLIEIHIFCDASKLAYGAAAYVKVRKQNEVLVNLIASKTRVAPLKAVTLPRLELLGALVAARLSSRVQEIVRKKKECKVFHWTDSKIVLFWIKGCSKRWKQFVANREQEISELTDPDSWFHCSGQDNPSDFLSRGLSVDTLISNNKWWTGPAFLRTDELPKTVSECPELNEVDYLPELKSKDSKEHTVLTLNFNQTFFDHLLSRSNKFLTIVRVLSFLYRFLFNIRNPTNKKTGPLTSDEMKEAEIYLMKQVQLSSFYKEIRAMQNGDDFCNKSKILNLSPFLDDKGIIRVGGRLKHSRLPYSSKHPILLPAKICNNERNGLLIKKNLKLGDMVLIREENLPPCKWLLGRVVKIYMGKDKKVRVVDIKTGKVGKTWSVILLKLVTLTNTLIDFGMDIHEYQNVILCGCNGLDMVEEADRQLNFGITFQDGDRFNSCQVIYSQFGLAIHQNDHQARRRFVEWAQNEIVVVPDFHKRILFSDEAHFSLNGYVNKQNCCIWSEANPQVYVETPLHPEKLTVWCALYGLVESFFKNDEGYNVTVNGDRYRAMITNFFIPELNNHDVQELWFQQDGATCHTARATIDLLKDTFCFTKILKCCLEKTIFFLPFSITESLAELVPETDEIGNVIEEVVTRDLARQINLEVDSDNVQELLDSRNQELTIDELPEKHEQDREELESL